MIKLYRNIRKRLLADQRLSKYFLYAFGEIILVVIGILIALQINTWNENRKSQEELQTILENLSREFQTNQQELDRTLKAIEHTRSGGLEILELTGKERLLTEDSLNQIIERPLFFPTWRPSNYTLKELNNTGRLGLIKDEALKKLLFEWDQNIEFIEEWNRRMEESSQTIVDYIKENGSIRDINYDRIASAKSSLEVSNLPLLQDTKFENHIDQKVLYSLFMETDFHKVDTLIQNILKRIKLE